MKRILRFCVALAAGVSGRADIREPGVVIQTVALEPSRPYFVPTHPRVTSTIRFPREIGPPEGAVGVFTEDAQRQAGEYLVGWQQGDAYFTVLPLKPAPLANLNVPFAGETYVLYFYVVSDPLQATAVLNLVAGADAPPSPGADGTRGERPPARVVRQVERPANDRVAPTPARLIGFLDRLKLIHATPAGPLLKELAEAMDVEVALAAEDAAVSRPPGTSDGVEETFSRSAGNVGYFDLLLLRAVRDRRLNCIGFVCLIRNTSDSVLTFDVNSLGARAGAEYLTACIADAPATLPPGEQCPAYFVVNPPANSPLRAANDWRISVDLVSPRGNPGAAISGAFGAKPPQP